MRGGGGVEGALPSGVAGVSLRLRLHVGRPQRLSRRGLGGMGSFGTMGIEGTDGVTD